jgi:hypothetical protein
VSSLPEMPKAVEERFLAGVKMVERTGSSQFQLRWSDDEEPTVWFAVAIYPDKRWDTAAGHNPFVAVARLLETLIDGGTCKHCGRPTGLDPTSLETMPMNKLICWYQYDPELKTFRRGCE